LRKKIEETGAEMDEDGKSVFGRGWRNGNEFNNFTQNRAE